MLTVLPVDSFRLLPRLSTLDLSGNGIVVMPTLSDPTATTSTATTTTITSSSDTQDPAAPQPSSPEPSTSPSHPPPPFLPLLEEFWFSANALSGPATFEAIRKELGSKEKLQTVYFEGNPFEREAGAGYRRKVRLALPRVVQIDATFVRR